MLEKVLVGGRIYWGWITLLLALMVVGTVFYFLDWEDGLNRQVIWGLNVGVYTFLVGVAASAVMIVLPYYLYNARGFGRITALAEFLGAVALIMVLIYVIVDLGRPERVFNIILHPNYSSIFFWNVVVFTGYILINLVCGWFVTDAERKGEPPVWWIKPLTFISLAWAISIHTCTAFIYCALPGRDFWFTALMAPRFLASAFASGPALLIILCFILKKFANFDPGWEAIKRVAQITTYAMIINVFFLLLEFHFSFYSMVPGHSIHFKYLLGLGIPSAIAPWEWVSIGLACLALTLLMTPRFRLKESTLVIGCIAVFGSIFMDKSLGLVVPGFVPSQTGKMVEYWPTASESLIALGVWAAGCLLLTILYKIVVSVKKEIEVPG